MSEEKYYTSIVELGKLIHERMVSPVDIVEACLERIDILNPSLNAFITVLRDQAKEEAKAAEAEIRTGHWRGPLHGIPVGIKDFYDTAGIKTTAAFTHFKNRIPKKDAEAVARLKNAGAIIIGKMNMHQLGMGTTGLDSCFGPVRNPWNADHISGGSSAGSAAAIASGLCYATLDTDAIGSCRLPAACCGVTGFKGTYDLVSMNGILEGEQPPDEMILWLGHAGITTRYVEDTAIVLDVLANRKESAATFDFFGAISRKRKLRIGVANNISVQEQVSESFGKAVGIIRGFGHTMSSVPVPFGDPDGGIKNIMDDRRTIEEKSFRDIDVIVLPTTITSTLTVKTAGSDLQALSPANTAFANYYGLPAISVPCGFDSHQLPLGFQIVGKPWDDSVVLQLACQYQRATEYNRMHPVK